MRITLGVTGGVAAYKSAELVRRLQQEGHSVQVVMTRAAREFITPLTFAALSGQKVITDLFAKSPGGEANLETAIEHIAVAQRTDLLLVAPATADILAKFARGIADDFLTTLYLASTAPVVVAPAMNVNMWQHAATQENVAMLRARGVQIVEPSEGYLACGMTGPGRLAEQEEILKAVQRSAAGKAGFGRGDRSGHRRADLRGHRSGALPDQSLVGQDGLRRCGSGGAAWRESGTGQRADGAGDARRVSSAWTCAAPEEMQRAVQAAISGLHHRGFRGGGGGLPSCRKSPLRRSSAAKEALTIRLEPNPDILATRGAGKGRAAGGGIRGGDGKCGGERAEETNAEKCGLDRGERCDARKAPASIRTPTSSHCFRAMAAICRCRA